MMARYTANVTRDGRWWMVAIPELDELTQARRLSEVELMARECIAVHTGQSINGVEVDVQLDDIGGIDVTDKVRRIHRDRALAFRVQQRLADEQTDVARRLVAAHVPLRDVGEVLGISHQRVQQLVTE